jgi:hypothetical protein
MKVQVWYGTIDFGDFVMGKDSYPVALVRKISEKVMMSEEDVDDYMVANSYDSYLIPRLFTGEIYFENHDHKGLKNETV